MSHRASSARLSYQLATFLIGLMIMCVKALHFLGCILYLSFIMHGLFFTILYNTIQEQYFYIY